jgi:hypothetical protein
VCQVSTAIVVEGGALQSIQCTDKRRATQKWGDNRQQKQIMNKLLLTNSEITRNQMRVDKIVVCDVRRKYMGTETE